jgi:uncharacterized protein YbjT (DUF2867 family)
MKILVMAAAGNQGKILLPKLRAAGFEIRAFRATSGREDELRAMGAGDVITGDANDGATLRRALKGVDTVYHIGPAMHPQEFEMGLAMVGAAVEAGVGHLIYSSVLHAIASKLIQHKLKRDIEEKIIESGLDFTILHPADYMMPQLLTPAFERGVYEWFFNPDSPQTMVDLHDFAEVVVKVAAERQRHFGATYELCAPGAHSGKDIGAAIAAVTGRPIQVRVATPDEWSDLIMHGGSGPGVRYQSGVVRACALWYSQYRFLGNPNVLTWLLGRSPITLQQFIMREWNAFNAQRSA